jgi:hypothetical protein
MKKQLLAITCLLLLSAMVHAQTTTASMSGQVRDNKGEDIPGATVFVVHVPTGTKYGAATSVDGRYFIANMNPGGPYKVTVSFVGYNNVEKEIPALNLGSNTGFNYVLVESAQQLEEVKVVANRESDPTAGVNIGKEQIRILPTLGRSIQDFTRLTPQSSNNSFAGTNFRYNNVTIDGAINNDAIGFSPSLGGSTGTSGMPGSSTRSNSVSLDAIQDIQVQLAPYDVKIGNFTGGSINAVTRTGTNEITGSVYAFGRNAAITGPNNAGDGSKIPSNYHDYQLGFRVGLPVIKDKLFFFTNEEITDRQEPIFFGAGQSGGLIDAATAHRIADTVRNRYGFDVGGFGNYTIYSKSTKFFNRIDWNINDKHSLSIRNNTTLSEATNLERDVANFRFASMDFKQTNRQNSTVAELKSRFSNNLSNSLIIGYSNIKDFRDPLSQNSAFPQVEIGAGSGNTIFLGNDREATVFNLKQSTIEITDNLTFFKGKHTFLVGTHNELYNINYGFINAWNGRIAYRNLNEFLGVTQNSNAINLNPGTVLSTPNRVRGTYYIDQNGNFDATRNTRDYQFNNPYAQFRVNLYSAYLQDDIQLTSNFLVSPGIRFDYADLPKKPLPSPQLDPATPVNYSSVGATYSFTPLNQISQKILGNVLVSPRLGFSYDVKGDKGLVVRGGTGLFTGRVPFAWFGYAFYNDGVGYGSYDFNNIVANSPNGRIIGDPLRLAISGNPAAGIGTFVAATTPGAGGTTLTQPGARQVQVDLIDNNFKMPQVWRSNLAVDFLVMGYKFTLEGIYTKVIRDLKFQQVNLVDNVSYFSYDQSKQMPIYQGSGNAQRLNTSISNAYLLSNTDKGYRYSLTGQMSKQYPFGLNFSAAYTYGQSKDITNGIRNSMESNWQLNQSLTPNNPQLAYSNFDIRHRVVSTLGYIRNWNETNQTNLSFVFTTQSGVPFTWGLVNSNIAGTPQTAGLVYIPKDLQEAQRLVPNPAQAQAFNDFISNNSYLNSRRGNFTERNGGRTPWNTQLDMRLMHEFRFNAGKKFHSVQFTWDIINLANLINKTWGRVYFVSNTFNSTVGLGLTRLSGSAGTIGTSSPNPLVGGQISSTPGDIGNNYYPQFSFTQPTNTYSIDQLASRWQMQLGLRYSF